MFTKLITSAALVMLMTPVVAQSKKDSLGLPGDNFDLYGAMELFKKSENPEAFEKALNSNDNEINNLDLDANGKVDYIKVVDKTENNIHSIVMQVAVSKEELQDVAVIEIEKTGDNKAHIQIVGDEELYGKNYIIEPVDETKKGKEALATDDKNVDDVYKSGDDKSTTTDNTSGKNNSTNYDNNSGGSTTIINVWGWPSVQYIYGSSYMAYSSPWYWGYYPGWYQPWYPVYWRTYHRRMYHYHYPYYRRAYVYRSPVAHNYYYGRRSSASTVREYNRSGYYRQKQEAYKGNAQPGRRYNAQPANPRRGSEVREGRRSPNNQSPNQNRTRSNTQPARSNRESSPRQQSSPRSNTNNQRQKSSQGKQQVNPQPRQQSNRSREVSPQPRQQSAPQGGGGNRGGGGSSSPRGGGSQGGGRAGNR